MMVSGNIRMFINTTVCERGLYMSNRLAKQAEKWYDSSLWFRGIFLAVMLCIAWVFCVPSGLEALIDTEDAVQRIAVYEKMQIETVTTGKGKTRKEIYLCFADGTRVQAQVNTKPLKEGLREVKAGDELLITLDKSEEYLLGVQFRDEVLMDAEDSAMRMNISAWGFVVLGVLMGASVPIMMIRDAVRGMRRRK